MNMIRKLAVVALLLFTASIAMAAQLKDWSAGGTSTNLNWSLGKNWSDLVAPGAGGSNILFFENTSYPGAPTNVIGAVNNIVNSNGLVQQVGYSAFYVGVTNTAAYTTLIPNGVTLTISNVSKFTTGIQNARFSVPGDISWGGKVGMMDALKKSARSTRFRCAIARRF